MMMFIVYLSLICSVSIVPRCPVRTPMPITLLIILRWKYVDPLFGFDRNNGEPALTLKGGDIVRSLVYLMSLAALLCSMCAVFAFILRRKHTTRYVGIKITNSSILL